MLHGLEALARAEFDRGLVSEELEGDRTGSSAGRGIAGIATFRFTAVP